MGTTVKKSTKCVCYVNAENVSGFAEYSASQVEKINSQKHSKLNKKSTYLVLPQWIHKEKLEKEYKGYTSSKKIFVVELVDGLAVSAFSMPIGQLTDRYLLEQLSDVKPLIPAAIRNVDGVNLWRVKEGFKLDDATVKLNPVVEEGYVPQKGEDCKSYINRAFMFTIAKGGHFVWKPEMRQNSSKTGYDFANDGTHVILQDPQWVYRYDIQFCSPNDELGRLEDYFNDVPEIERYNWSAE